MPSNWRVTQARPGEELAFVTRGKRESYSGMKEKGSQFRGPDYQMKTMIILSALAMLSAPVSHGRELKERFPRDLEEAVQSQALASQDSSLCPCHECSNCEDECGPDCTHCESNC
jgi:hypothetical protein